MPKFKLDGRLWESEQELPLFHAMVKLYIMQEDDEPPTERQRAILLSLNDLPNGLMSDITTGAVAYYRKIDSVVNLADEGRAIDERAIADHFRIKSVLIPEIRNCQIDYFFMSFDCDWEEERGMQILIGDGSVILCGAHTTLPFSSQWREVITLQKDKQIEALNKIPVD